MALAFAIIFLRIEGLTGLGSASAGPPLGLTRRPPTVMPAARSPIILMVVAYVAIFKRTSNVAALNYRIPWIFLYICITLGMFIGIDLTMHS